MVENETIAKLCGALATCGIPESAIVVDRSLRYQHRNVAYPDVAIIGEDHETVVAVFDLKVGRAEKEEKYTRVLHSYHEIVDRCPCYVVSLESTGNLLVARLSLRQSTQGILWVDADDANQFRKLIGSYHVESAAAIDSDRTEASSAKQSELGYSKWIIGIVGLLLTVAFAWMEWFHHEFSWKVYSVFFATLILFAAASGYSVYLKSGEHEFRIGRESSMKPKEDD